MWNVSICHGKLQDLLEILTSKSGIMAEFSKYRFSRKEIDFQPNEVCSDLFHIKVYLTAEYERNRCFSCCHHFSKIFDFWQHSFLNVNVWRKKLGKNSEPQVGIEPRTLRDLVGCDIVMLLVSSYVCLSLLGCVAARCGSSQDPEIDPCSP